MGTSMKVHEDPTGTSSYFKGSMNKYLHGFCKQLFAHHLTLERFSLVYFMAMPHTGRSDMYWKVSCKQAPSPRDMEYTEAYQETLMKMMDDVMFWVSQDNEPPLPHDFSATDMARWEAQYPNAYTSMEAYVSENTIRR
jgi:hypothetical protein